MTFNPINNWHIFLSFFANQTGIHMINKPRFYDLASVAILMVAFPALGQVHIEEKNSDRYNNYDNISKDTLGRSKETVHTFFDGKEYLYQKINGKLTELYVDEVKIPDNQFSQYSDAINRITKQIEIDNIQAAKDQAQARLDQEEARKDQEQAKRDQAQARLDQEEARKDQEQAKRDQTQARADQEQAKKDRALAKEDQEMMRQMIADLIKDGIVPDQKALFSITLSPTEMRVNDLKQPDTIFLRYKAKYNKWAILNFSYGGNNQNYQGVHFSRITD
jgi:colicin import membrane protein